MEQIAGEKTIRFVEYKMSQDIRLQGEITRFHEDLASNRLAGILVGMGPGIVSEMSLLNCSRIPHVFFQHDTGYGTPSVIMDYDSFQRRAVECLLARGRRRIAHFYMEFASHVPQRFPPQLKAMGVEMRPYWIQGVLQGSRKQTTANIINMMMQLEGEKRPDALIVYDDNLIDEVDTGLVAAGVKVPEDLDVVALCNYPTPASSVFPIKLLGLDCRQVLEECLRILDMQRRKEKPPAMQWLPPLFEEELLAGGTGKPLRSR
jgi:DNA-binding LacI/PurR family transcriptional regulator